MNSNELQIESKAASEEIPVEHRAEELRWRIGRTAYNEQGRAVSYYIETECGRYSVCDVYLGDRKTCEAWGRARRGEETAQLAVGLATREEAVKVCEAHAMGHRVPLQRPTPSAEG